jgi:hypothetical protein
VTLTRIQQSIKLLQRTAHQIQKQMSKNVPLEKRESNPSIDMSLYHDKESTREHTPEDHMDGAEHKQTRTNKPKLLLLSDFHGAELLLPLSKIRRNDYDFTADIIKYGTTERVLQGVKEKIADFTKSDCLVVMCGGSDYNINPINKVLNVLKNTAKNASHTNVIFCDIPYSIHKYADQYNSYVEKINYALH